MAADVDYWLNIEVVGFKFAAFAGFNNCDNRRICSLIYVILLDVVIV